MASTVVTRDSLAEELKTWVEGQDVPMPMTAAREEVRWFFETITEHLIKGNEIRVHGFGAFKTAQRPARTARNPRTGETVKVAARRVVRFAPSTTLSASLKGGSAVKKTTVKGKK